ncbi:pilus assembly protein TadE [Trinickia symbiotica]|uniref:Pilus assembly protein TadE n=1 Tax=Trinickia symbiotica TaxID=863227 RepID=A0A2T3XZR0_9BURK|nr:TadE/TadG family type IV pilus assembly protein [Trinickia symbiotica]PTB21962.1 pilus assembly protein TadE [Trinickia symbiotica]
MRRLRRDGRHSAAARGSAVVEFALIFPLLFAMLYGLVTYSVILVAQQNLTLAAEEGARAALNYQNASNAGAALAARGQTACTVASKAAAWLAANATCSAQASTCSYDATMDCIELTLSYDYAGHPLVPTLPLLSLAVPRTLTSAATVQVNPENLL